MRQETLKQIINIIPATGWRAVFMEESDGTMRPIIEPCTYFAAVRAITLMPGFRYHHDRASDEQNIEYAEEYVELHSQDEGGFENPTELSWFYKYLGPGEEWKGAEDQKAMEAHFAEKERVRKIMLEADAHKKKAQEPPHEEKGGEKAA